MVDLELTWSLLGVYPESTRSLPGVDLEWLKPLKTALETFIFALGFGHRFGTVFGSKSTPDGDPKWTKTDKKSHWIWAPSPEPFFGAFFFRTCTNANCKVSIFNRFFQYNLRMRLATLACTWVLFEVSQVMFFGPQLEKNRSQNVI